MRWKVMRSFYRSLSLSFGTFERDPEPKPRKITDLGALLLRTVSIDIFSATRIVYNTPYKIHEYPQIFRVDPSEG
jgi:hypothetical protein